jgi:Icc-related predicted phosphoesterase
MKLLAVSDQRLSHMLNADYLRQHYGDIQILVSCGDMDPDYLNFIATILSVPLYYVRGNHDQRYTENNPGGVNLHRRFETYKQVTFAGLEGSIRYNRGEPQFTQLDMYLQVLPMMPQFLLRRAVTGYGVDVFVAHSPPRFIHDREDWAHRGFRAFKLLMRLARPRYFIHGHVDIYDQREQRETDYLRTRVININPSRILTVEKGHR